MTTKNDKQKGNWNGRDKWNTLRGVPSGERVWTTVLRHWEDTRWLKGERETKDHLKKDCLKRERQGGVEELECGQGGGTPQRVGRRMWRPYAPTGATGDDDENDLLVRWRGEEVIWSLLALTLLSHAVIVLLPSVCIVYLWMKTFKKYRMIILACPNSAGCIVRHENKLLLSEV